MNGTAGDDGNSNDKVRATVVDIHRRMFRTVHKALIYRLKVGGDADHDDEDCNRSRKHKCLAGLEDTIGCSGPDFIKHIYDKYTWRIPKSYILRNTHYKDYDVFAPSVSLDDTGTAVVDKSIKREIEKRVFNYTNWYAVESIRSDSDILNVKLTEEDAKFYPVAPGNAAEFKVRMRNALGAKEYNRRLVASPGSSFGKYYYEDLLAHCNSMKLRSALEGDD